MVYAHDSKSCGATHESSSLSPGTTKEIASLRQPPAADSVHLQIPLWCRTIELA